MKILFIGDIVGRPGREAVKEFLPRLKEEYALDFVVANAENSAAGSGITSKTAGQLFEYGADVLTSGDHIWKKEAIFELINKESRILRPLNFPGDVPGRGQGLFTTKKGARVGVININGRIFMEPLDCPFRAALSAAEELSGRTKVIIVDIHAEATSEKAALGRYLDGKVSAVLGTHTHIQTADEKILPAGTAYLTDAGMTGPHQSVIGRRVDDVLERFLTAIPRKLEVAEGDVQLQGAVVDIDESTGRARSIERIQKKV